MVVFESANITFSFHGSQLNRSHSISSFHVPHSTTFLYLFMLTVREMRSEDVELICDYWTNTDHDAMRAMGVDVQKIYSREKLYAVLGEQLHQSYTEKQAYCIIWESDGKAIGHCNVNKILYGEEAYMHLHLWNSDQRKKGMGSELVKLSTPLFFRNLQLKKLICEPYKLNPAPNKTLPKAGFSFVKSYTCTPGWVNFEQEVNRWELSAPSE